LPFLFPPLINFCSYIFYFFYQDSVNCFVASTSKSTQKNVALHVAQVIDVDLKDDELLRKRVMVLISLVVGVFVVIIVYCSLD